MLPVSRGVANFGIMPDIREQVVCAWGSPGRPWSVMRPAILLLGLLMTRLVAAQDNSLATTNQWRIQSFWNAVEASNSPVTVLSFGDSVSEDGLSIQKQLFLRLQNHFGSNGIAFGPYFQVIGDGTA
jgi:hypothetical protein